MRRPSVALASLLALTLLSAFAAPASDQPKVAASSAQAPALSSEQAAQLHRLQRLGAPDPKNVVAAAASGPPIKFKNKKEISCGIWVYPPSPNPMAASNKLFFVNDTGSPLPAGTHIQWEVQGMPATCCKGTVGPTGLFPPNPPTAAFFYSMAALVVPAQPFTRPCKAWAILP